MRKKLGLYTMLVALLGLGIWTYFGAAERIEAQINEAAQNVVSKSLHGATASVSGRDITLSGVAQDAAEREALFAAASAINGRRVVIDNFEVLEVVRPYVFEARKTADGISISGNVPFEADRSILETSFETDGSRLNLSAGQPNEGWIEAVTGSRPILDFLDEGSVIFRDSQIEITGEISNPYIAEDILSLAAGFPEGYTSSSALSVPETNPYIFEISKTEDATRYSVMSPNRQTEAEMTAIFPPEWTGNVIPASGAPNESWGAAIGALVNAVSLSKGANVRVENTAVSFVADAPTLGVQDEIEAALQELSGGYQIVQFEISVPPSIPYIFSGSKTSEGLSYSGYIPSNAIREQIATFIGEEAAAGLERRFGMPDGFWPEFIREGVSALGVMENGQISIEDRTMRLTGRVANPVMQQAVEAALSDLPAGYAAEFDLVLEDDGLPTFLALAYEPEKPLSVSGKAPQGLTNAVILQNLGLSEISGEPRSSVLTGLEFYTEKLTGLRDILSEFKLLNVTFSETDAKISGVGQSGRTADQLNARLIEIFGETVEADIQETSLDVPEGTVRQNELTGFLEIFRFGNWQEFTSEEELINNCSSRISSELGEAKIEFSTGSATIDSASNELLDRLAEIIGPCLDNSTATIELGGHTDSQGDPNANLALSEARAFAVRDALLERGIVATRVTAIGFGQSVPIASNDTEEGRAQNRRTTFTWTTQ